MTSRAMDNGYSIRKNQPGNSRGFTLIELIIVVAVVGILLGIAVPAYDQYIVRANRTEGKNYMARVQAAQERFFTNNSTYSNSMTGAGAAGLGFATSNSPDGRFTVGIVLTPNGRGYTITLQPTGGYTDPQCSTLTVDQLGVKDATGPGATTCWRQ